VSALHLPVGVRAAVHFTAEAGVKVTGGLGVGCSVQASISANGMAGPIPVTAAIQGELSASAGVGGILDSGGSLHVDVGASTLGTPPVLLWVPEVTFSNPSFGFTAQKFAQASAGIGVAVKLGVGNDNVASATLNLGSSIDFSAQPGACTWDARFGQFSAEGKLLRWNIESPKTPTLFTKQLWHDACGGSAGGGSNAPTQATAISRQSPVTAAATIAPGFGVTESSSTGKCIGASEVGQAYRCFTGNRVLDPCYAIADPFTGDGTGVACPLSPFGNSLYEIVSATGLSILSPESFDEPNGIVLASGTRCTEGQGAHSVDASGRVVDYYCDDKSTVVLRGLHKSSAAWTADVAHEINGGYVDARTEPIVSAVLLQHDEPPANRPVTDAGNATALQLDSFAPVHHEVDCGSEQTVLSSSTEEEILDSGVDCGEAQLIVVEWDNFDALESGWTCSEDANQTLLCQQAPTVDATDAPAFFSSTHIRAIAFG
jgi:hypothetical protein